MGRALRSLIILVSVSCGICRPVSASEDILFTETQSNREFAREVSALVASAWNKWQEGVVINNVLVDGSRGVLLEGSISLPILSKALVVQDFDGKGKTAEYISFISIVFEALEEGMTKWQSGYSNKNIIFPQGVSCVYTLTPCHNIPSPVSTGRSKYNNAMSREYLYNSMLHNPTRREKGSLKLLKAAAWAISDSFNKWEDECNISDIIASGGVAPKPSPLGNGPGPVTGAKGNGGRLTGAYFDGDYMFERMMEYLEK